jgi:hypothetical protein
VRARRSRWPSSGGVDLCGREHDRLQLICQSLGRRNESVASPTQPHGDDYGCQRYERKSSHNHARLLQVSEAERIDLGERQADAARITCERTMVCDATQGVGNPAHAMPNVRLIVMPHLDLLPRAEVPSGCCFDSAPAAESASTAGQESEE